MARNLLNLTGEGVEPLEIAAIDKAIEDYQKKKAARCKASPGEIEAKGVLRQALHANREKLPLNAEGVPFYRYDDGDTIRDYLLDEKLKIEKVQEDED